VRKSFTLPFTPIPLPLILTFIALSALTAVTAVVSPIVAVALAGVTFALGVLLTIREGLPRFAIIWLGVVLLGYALLDRGFAYVGVPPLFIGEVTLALCVAAVLFATRPAWLLRSPLTALLVIFMLIGAAATIPHIGKYGLDSLRDSATWYYATFAIVTAVLLVRTGTVVEAARQYARFVPLFLLFAPVAIALDQFANSMIPRFPGSGVPVLELKFGDVAVHLAIVAGLLILGLGARFNPRLTGRGREWMWWGLWLVASVIPVFRVRAGLVAILLAGLLIVLFRPGSRWGKPFAIVALTVALFFASGVTLRLGSERYIISAETLLLNLQSITGSSGDTVRDGTKEWRLNWWKHITKYTVNGPYFWTGKGNGVNLADADGFQVYDDGSLRSPHSIHYVILARSGVPGLVAWIALQAWFVGSLFVAYFRARAAGQDLWARLNLWVLAAWVAFIINASFDVYLEGPQGGIWFWCVFGYGMALLEAQRRARLSGDASPLPRAATAEARA